MATVAGQLVAEHHHVIDSIPGCPDCASASRETLDGVVQNVNPEKAVHQDAVEAGRRGEVNTANGGIPRLEIRPPCVHRDGAAGSGIPQGRRQSCLT